MNRLKNRSIFLQVIVFILGMILVLTACAPAATQSQAEATVSGVAAPGEVQRVTLEDSKTAFDNGSAVFLDVRSADSFATSHIPGAISIPLAELETRATELDPNQWIITYCT